MKDFILITILTGALVTFCSGLAYCHISEQKYKQKQAYQQGYKDGRADRPETKDERLMALAEKLGVKIEGR